MRGVAEAPREKVYLLSVLLQASGKLSLLAGILKMAKKEKRSATTKTKAKAKLPSPSADEASNIQSASDDEEWSEPFHLEESTDGEAKTNGSLITPIATNGTRVDFTGSLINAAAGTKSLASSSASVISEFESMSDDFFDPIPHAPMYPNYSSKHLTAGYSKRDLYREEGISFLKDDPNEMTRARRMALKLLDKKWYNPNAGKPTNDVESSYNGALTSSLAPSLKRAWAYFEHVTLMRYFVTGQNQNAFEMSLWGRFRYASLRKDEDFENAMPGEKRRPTRLYDYFATPHMQVRPSIMVLQKNDQALWADMQCLCFYCAAG